MITKYFIKIGFEHNNCQFEIDKVAYDSIFDIANRLLPSFPSVIKTKDGQVQIDSERVLFMHVHKEEFRDKRDVWL